MCGVDTVVRVSKVRSHIAISLDGFVAGPNQSLDNPIGEGGMRLHLWMFETESWLRHEGREGGLRNADSQVLDEVAMNVGAYIMGRKMFGGGPGPWDSSWEGWWGEEPPYHVPVFVLTHHERKPLEMKGGTTFYFVTDGIESALKQAQDAARGKDVRIGGGVATIRQYLSAGKVDEMHLAMAPVLMGEGENLFAGLELHAKGFRVVRVAAGENATHVV